MGLLDNWIWFKRVAPLNDRRVKTHSHIRYFSALAIVALNRKINLGV